MEREFVAAVQAFCDAFGLAEKRTFTWFGCKSFGRKSMIDYRHQYGTPWYPYIVRLSKRSFPLPASPGEQAGSTEGS